MLGENLLFFFPSALALSQPWTEKGFKKKNQPQSLQAAKEPLKIFVFSGAGLRLGR